MKTEISRIHKSILQFRGKKTEIHFQSSNQGINIICIGDTNIFDTLTFEERDLILLHIINLTNNK